MIQGGITIVPNVAPPKTRFNVPILPPGGGKRNSSPPELRCQPNQKKQTKPKHSKQSPPKEVIIEDTDDLINPLDTDRIRSATMVPDQSPGIHMFDDISGLTKTDANVTPNGDHRLVNIELYKTSPIIENEIR